MTNTQPSEWRQLHSKQASRSMYFGGAMSGIGVGFLASAGLKLKEQKELEANSSTLETTIKDCQTLAIGYGFTGASFLIAGLLSYYIGRHFFTLDKKGYFGK